MNLKAKLESFSQWQHSVLVTLFVCVVYVVVLLITSDSEAAIATATLAASVAFIAAAIVVSIAAAFAAFAAALAADERGDSKIIAITIVVVQFAIMLAFFHYVPVILIS